MKDTKNTIKIVEKSIVDLNESEYNPRTLKKSDYEQLRKSLKTFGLVDPILINKHKGREGVIIGGHQRFRIARDLGYKTVPCVELDLDEKKEKELNLRLNRNHGDFDYDKLANYFDTDMLYDVGFNEQEMGVVMDEFEEEFYSITDENCEMPIVPKFSESYDSVIIFANNELDFNWLKNVMKITQAKDYKNTRIGESRVLTVKQFQKIWEDGH
tara:strand:- start:14 stop:652 length:639 start_codon:yes stop_codon:yes gene_type:complete